MPLRTILSAVLALCTVLTLMTRSARSQSSEIPANQMPLATVDGKSIYERDLTGAAQGELKQLRQREYQVKREAVESFLDRQLIETEAARLRITPAQLLRSGTDHTLLLTRLRKQERVSIFLAPPRTSVTYDPFRLKGNPKAQVMLVEFGDFECPFCRKMEPTLVGLLAEYPGKIKLAYRDFPLREAHRHAELAAEASRCAAEQGMFWRYHDLLFASHASLDRTNLLREASVLKLDEPRFKQCLNEGKYMQQVAQDAQDGIRAGVSGTPGFFINGTFLAGAQPATAFETIIDRELSRCGASGARNK